jgi:hypothetical protein
MDKVTLKDIYDAVSDLRNEIGGKYVTKEEFAPVKAIVYGLVSLILISVVGALITLVVTRG